MSNYYRRYSEDDGVDYLGVATEICDAAQTILKQLPAEYLNLETENLGKMENGKRVGKPTARNPGVIDGAKVVINKTLKYANITLTVAAIVIDTWRIISAYKDDVYVRENADKIIEELEDSIRTLNQKLENTNSTQRKCDIKITIDHLENVLRDVKRTKNRIPVKYFKTVSSSIGNWGGGLIGGASGAWAGAQTGAMFGACFGPAGAAVGAPIGAIIGAISGGIGGSYCGSTLAEGICEGVLKLND